MSPEDNSLSFIHWLESERKMCSRNSGDLSHESYVVFDNFLVLLQTKESCISKISTHTTRILLSSYEKAEEEYSIEVKKRFNDVVSMVLSCE